MVIRKLLAVAFSLTCGIQAAAAATAFTYHGELYNGDTPANGTYRFVLTPYQDANASQPIARPYQTQSVTVVDGRFRARVAFDFDNVDNRRIWLAVDAIDARGNQTEMSGRQEVLLPAPADAMPTAKSAHPAGTTMQAADSRFSLMWLSGGVPHRAAIRGDASIRDTDDAGLTVVHTGTRQYCITATSPSEGTVGVAQNDGGDVPRTIDVSMGIGDPCPSVPGAQIFVETWVAF